MRIRKDPSPVYSRRGFAGRGTTIGCLVALGLVLATPEAARAQVCTKVAPDSSICPADMPPPEALGPLFLIGSASGSGYYGDCGLIDQLVACGWPREKLFPLYREADPEDLVTGARAMFDQVETIRRSLGADKVDLFGYSLGGPRIWAYLTLMDGWRHARRVVLWASPNYGMTFTPYTKILNRTKVLPWHRDVTEGSPFNECVEGRSTDPSCANPFTDFPPRAITAAQAAAGAEGTVYYNLYSADLPCETCTCKIWCDAPGQSQSAAHPDSDLFIAAENSRLPNAYNIEVERLAHWDFIQGDASQYTTALDWLARYGTARPRRNDTWAQTMQALVGRDPTQAPVGGPPAADCANPHVHATFGLGGGPSDPCAPARCGTLSASGPNGGGPANLVAIVGLILGAILLAKARARSSRGESAAIAAALLAALGASGCANSLTDQTRLDQCVLDPLCTRTLAVGHGGSPREAPENTVPGILAAWNSGADMVELDVRASADGALVLMRDSTVDRTTTGRGFVTDLTLEQLRGFEVHAVRAGGPTTTIPTLEEALDTVRGRMLCALEIRQADMARVIDALHARGAASACLLVTPSLPYAVLAKRMDPEIAVASWAYDWRGVNDLARATRTDVIFVPNRLDSREVVDLIRALGRKVATSLIGGPDLAGVASPGSVYGASVAFGTSMILTDFVPQVAAFLETRSPAIL